MRFVKEKGPVPLLGVEAEVIGWHGGRKDVDVVKDLDKLGYMDASMYEKQHKYHCPCKPCTVIGNSKLHPPQFKMQYDASLPKEGAEYISSPFPALVPIIEDMVEALLVIGQDAYGPDVEATDQKGRPASAGLHIHASVKVDDWAIEKGILKDAIRTFYMYYPEIILLASSTGRRRFMHYRWPRYTHHDHHSFLIQSRGHLEWRVFEAELSDPTYLFGSMVMAASLTYLVQEPRILSTLETCGTVERWDSEILDDLYLQSAADGLPEGSPIDLDLESKMQDIVMSNISHRRMDVLTTVLQELTYNKEVWDRLQHYLERAWQYAS